MSTPNTGARPSASEAVVTPGVLWSAWPEDDSDSDPRIDPMAQKSTEWFVGRWPIGADEPECRILIGEGRSAEILARRIAERLTSILNTDAIKAAALAPSAVVPESVRQLRQALNDVVGKAALARTIYETEEAATPSRVAGAFGVIERFAQDVLLATAPPSGRAGDGNSLNTRASPAPASAGAMEVPDIIAHVEKTFGARGVSALVREAFKLAKHLDAVVVSEPAAPEPATTGKREVLEHLLSEAFDKGVLFVDGLRPIGEEFEWACSSAIEDLIASPEALAVLSATGPQPAGGDGTARPISTAPRDGTMILLYGRMDRSGAAPTWFIGKWFVMKSHGDGGWWVSSSVKVHATDWAPLPVVPTSADAGAEGGQR